MSTTKKETKLDFQVGDGMKIIINEFHLAHSICCSYDGGSLLGSQMAAASKK